MSIRSYIDKRPGLKHFIHWLLIPAGQARPRRWVSWFVNPLVHKIHRTSGIRSPLRLDVLPFNGFTVGKNSTIESFSVVNNGVGEVFIGDNCTVGIGAVVIGPVHIDSDVIIAQHVVLSGLNHTYTDVQKPIREQGVTTHPIHIEKACWIGANAVITGGVRVGKHSVVAGGSVVTRDVPPFSVVGGNPARILKQYNPENGEWEKPAVTLPLNL